MNKHKLSQLESIVIAAMIVCGPSAVAFAQEPSVYAELSHSQVALGEAVGLDVTINGVQDAPAPEVKIPDVAVQYIGPSTMVSIVNGRMSAAVTHRYSLLAQKQGVIGIDPITFTVDGKTLKTQPLTLEVLAASARSSGPASRSGSSSSAPEPVSLGNALQLKIGVDKQKLYVNEAVPARVQLLVGGIPVRGIEMPEFQADGFLVKPLGQPRQSDVIAGAERFTLLEFDTTIVPMRVGTLSLGPATLTCQVVARRRPSSEGRRSQFQEEAFDSFFGDSFFGEFLGRTQTQPVSVTADAVIVEVLPLPKEDRPHTFLGAIGDFSLDVESVPKTGSVGEPVTVTMTVHGSGNLDTVSAPVLQTDEKVFKRYEAQIKSTDAGSKVFEQVLIPLSADIKEISGAVFSFFDPQERAYRTLTAPPISIEVTPATASEAPRVIDAGPSSAGASNVSSGPVGRDIVYLKEHIGNAQPFYGRWHGLPSLLWVYGLPFFLLGASALARKIWERHAADPAAARASKALSRAMAHWHQADHFREQGRAREAYAEIFRALQGYAGDRFNVPNESLTRIEIESLLHAHGAQQEVISVASELCERCDAARFGDPSAYTGRLANTLTSAQAFIRRLEGMKLK